MALSLKPLQHYPICSFNQCVPQSYSATALISRQLHGVYNTRIRSKSFHYPSKCLSSSQTPEDTSIVTIVSPSPAHKTADDSSTEGTRQQALQQDTIWVEDASTANSSKTASISTDNTTSAAFNFQATEDSPSSISIHTETEPNNSSPISNLQETLAAVVDLVLDADASNSSTASAQAAQGKEPPPPPATAAETPAQLSDDDPRVAPYTSFSNIDDETSPADIEAAKQVARDAAAAAEATAAAQAPASLDVPPVEFSALVGLGIALILTGVSNAALCQPVSLNYTPQRIVRQCTSCCGSPALQAQHQQYIIRQPQRLLPPLPLPVRQHASMDLDSIASPSYRVKPLVTVQSTADDGIRAALVAAREWVHGRIAYQLQQLGTANISTKVLVLWLFAAPFILLFGYMYHKAAHVKFGEAMYKVYALLYRVPGIGIAKEDNIAAYLVANLAFLAGLFTFAGILGIVSDEIKTSMKNSRTGNYNMRLSGHILILNWNNNTTALVRQIANAHSDGGMFNTGAPWPFHQKPPVVILADKNKAQMDDSVHEMLRDRGLQLEVHTREGNPYKMSELRRVAASRASTIIVLHPDSASSPANAEAIKASEAMSITALGQQAGQRVVVQMTGLHSEQAAVNSLGVASRVAGRSAIQSLELPDRQLMLQLVTQTAAQPGILTCWLDILALAKNSAQFYCAELPQAQQQKQHTYAELRRAFANAVLCGYRLPNGEAVLNPAETDVPPPGSQLVFLGRGGAAHLIASPNNTLYDSAAKSAAERMKKERTYKSKPRHILVANWVSDGIPELMEGFSEFTPAGSTITFIMQGEPPAEWPVRLGHCKFNFVNNKNPTSVKALLEAGIKTADAVVLGSGASTGGDLEADARLLAAVLQVQDAVLASKRRDAPHLVAPVKRYATSKLAQQYLEALAAEQAARVEPAASIRPPPSQGAAATASSKTAQAAVAASTAAAGATTASSAPAVPSKHGGLLGVLVPGHGSSSSSSSSQQPQEVQRMVVCDSCEFLVPTDVTSALMTQVVSDPAYADIMNALLVSQEGMEMYLRNPASFNLPNGVPLSFAEVEESVRLTGQTALGYIKGKGSLSTAASNLGKHSKVAKSQRKVVLGPPASHTLTFDESDMIVVIAQDFNV